MRMCVEHSCPSHESTLTANTNTKNLIHLQCRGGSKLRSGRGVDSTASYARFLESQILKMQATYRTRHVLVPIGGDFLFVNTRLHFAEVDYLIHLLRKEHSKWNKYT